MGILDGILGPALTVATQAAGAHQQGEQQASKILQALRMQQAQMDHLGAQTEKERADARKSDHANKAPVLGEPDYAPAQAAVAGAEATAKVPAAVQQATATAPIARETHRVNRRTDVANPLPTAGVQPQLVTGVGPDGKPTYGEFDKGTHTIRPVDAGGMTPKGTVAGGLPAPIAAKVGQFGEMLKKAADLSHATDAIEVSLTNSASQDVAAHGVGAFGMHLPGTQGVGNMMVNRSPEYATYQAALNPFILAAAHALSGARINQDQVQQIRQSIEIKPGESTEARAQKRKNLVDLVNSIGGSLPGDAVSAQEDQMDPSAVATLKALSYRGARRSASAHGNSPSVGHADGAPTQEQQLWDAAVKLHGEAKVLQEVGPRP